MISGYNALPYRTYSTTAHRRLLLTGQQKQDHAIFLPAYFCDSGKRNFYICDPSSFMYFLFVNRGRLIRARTFIQICLCFAFRAVFSKFVFYSSFTAGLTVNALEISVISCYRRFLSFLPTSKLGSILSAYIRQRRCIAITCAVHE